MLFLRSLYSTPYPVPQEPRTALCPVPHSRPAPPDDALHTGAAANPSSMKGSPATYSLLGFPAARIEAAPDADPRRHATADTDDDLGDMWGDDGAGAPSGAFIRALAADLDELCGANASPCGGVAGPGAGGAEKGPGDLRAFFSAYAEPFPWGDYLARLAEYCECERATLVAACVYVGRAQTRCPALAITARNRHRLFATCLLLAIKFFEDETFADAHYAQVFGVPATELAALERALLAALRWGLLVPPAEYHRYERGLASGRDAGEGWE